MKHDRTMPYNHSHSGWNALLPPRMPKTEAPADSRVKTLVIGAGYTGLAAARRIAELEPDHEVLVVDGATIGEGASGRNSGFLSIHPSEPRASAHGTRDEVARSHIRIAEAGIDVLRSLVSRNDIACGWDEAAPRLTAAATKVGEQSARQARAQYEAWGVECPEFNQATLALGLGTSYYRYGYESLTRALVQPAALIRGLADSLPAAAKLLEQTTVLSFDGNGPFQVRTTKGDFVADRLIVANNSHARSLGLLRDRMIAIYTYGALTPELSDEDLTRFGTWKEWGILPANRMGTTLRKVGRRFLIRSGDSYEREAAPSKVRTLLIKLYRRRFPEMPRYELEHVWGGATAITHNGGFYFGSMRPGLFASVGCNGGGVVRGSIHGKLLAEMACGSQSELLSTRLRLAGPSWIPPEPARRVGVVSQIAWEQWRAGRER